METCSFSLRLKLEEEDKKKESKRISFVLLALQYFVSFPRLCFRSVKMYIFAITTIILLIREIRELFSYHNEVFRKVFGEEPL